ncbi:MAG: hypothetical protein ACFN1F_08015, partial [Segatella sp.]
WSLTPPSHPYHPGGTAVIFFCLHLLSPIASIFGSRMPFAARTFLSHPLQTPATEPGHCLIVGTKIMENMEKAKFFLGNLSKMYSNMMNLS